MANLIIKPTSGGSLILQDEGGTAANTIDASGNTTLAGTANNIGTVTGGTFNSTIGTSATFPAGSLVQWKGRQHNTPAHHYASSGASRVSHGDEDNLKFTFTPKSATSTIILEYFHGAVHTSSGGGWGHLAFTKGGDRNTWGGGLSGYNDGVGHFRSGFASQAGMYHTIYGRLIYQNDSTTAFELGLDVKWAAGSWYYAHNDAFQSMSAFEIMGTAAPGQV